jgi:folate-dependent phosphoribosylglycinamide formyltransferase PurN
VVNKQPKLERPIRVITFGSGPILTHDVRQFLCRLETHSEIFFLGAFCQAESQSFQAVVKDLWKRRGILAFPLLLASAAGGVRRTLLQWNQEAALNKKLEELSDRIHFVSDIHAPTVLAQVRALEPDLGLVYGSPILKPQLFEIPTLGTLGIHHGKVPQYRGNKTTFWAMYNGEEVAGVTIQKINAGLDTGSIVKEGEVTIGCRSQGMVWRELEALGLDLYIQAILEVKAGTAVYRPQTGSKGKLYRNPKLVDLLNFWGRQVKRRLGKP